MWNCAIRERESVILWGCGQHFATALKIILDGVTANAIKF